MADIPDYTALGTPQAPSPAPARRLALQGDLSGEVLAQAGEELGRSLDTLGTDIYERQQKDHIAAVNLARAQSSNASLDHQIAVESAAEQTRQGIANGEIPYEEARQHFNEQVAAIPPPNIPNLDAVGTENQNKYLVRSIATAGFKVDAAVDGARRQDFKDQFIGNMQRLDKLAGMPGADIEAINAQADAFRPLAIKAGVPAVEVDKAIADVKDSNWFNQADQRVMLAKDNWGALKVLQHDLSAADGYYAGRLKTARRDELLRSVVNDQLILENRAEHEHDKREAKAGQAMRQAGEMISSTMPLSAQNWAELGAEVQGTSYEAEFAGLQKNEEKVQEVVRMPPADQARYVQQEAGKLDAAQPGTMIERLQARANFERLQSAVNQNSKLMTDSPILWSANRNGTEVAEIDFTGLATEQGQAQIGQALADRMATIRALQAKNGTQIGDKPILPQEAAGLTSYLQSIEPYKRALVLTALRRSTKDDQTYQATMDQIAPHSPVTAIAGTMVGASAPSRTPVWFNPVYAPKLDDVQLVLHGEELLNPTSAGKAAGLETEKGGLKAPMPMPPDTGPNGLRTVFGNATSDMFRDNTQGFDAYFSVFKDAYAALLERKGNMKGTPDTQAQRQALQIALGQMTTFNGNQVSVPRGMDPSQFTMLVRAAVSQQAKDLKAPADWQQRLSGYQLVDLGRTLGSGRFGITIGGLPMVNPNGKGYFAIDLRGQYDPSRGATPAHERVRPNVPTEGFIYDPVARKLIPDPGWARTSATP